MYTRMYQNSYVVFVITFIMLSIFFYLFEIGYNIEIKDGKIVKKFSWKYPLAISLIIWLFWYFYLFPPLNKMIIEPPTTNDYTNVNSVSVDNNCIPRTKKLIAQKINMINWN